MKRRYKGSYTIEMALLLPVIALVFVVSVWGGFYYHDKNILSSCAYEIAVVGSTKVREEDAVTEEELKRAFSEKIAGKCILFSDIGVSVHLGEKSVEVEAIGTRRNMRTSVRHSAAVTEPETYIRKIRRLQ